MCIHLRGRTSLIVDTLPGRSLRLTVWIQYYLKVDLFIHSVNLFAKMKQSDSIQDSLPEDVAIKIASLLQVRSSQSHSVVSFLFSGIEKYEVSGFV